MDAKLLAVITSVISEAEKKGAEMALIEYGAIKARIPQRILHKQEGKTIVRRWEREGLVHPIKAGANTSSVLYDRMEVYKARMTDILYAYAIGELSQ